MKRRKEVEENNLGVLEGVDFEILQIHFFFLLSIITIPLEI